MTTQEKLNDTKVVRLLNTTPAYAYQLICNMEGKKFKWMKSSDFIKYYRSLPKDDPKRLALEEMATRNLSATRKKEGETVAKELAAKYKDTTPQTRADIRAEISQDGAEMHAAIQNTEQENVQEAPVNTAPANNKSNIELACATEAPAKNYKALEEAAWQDFGKGEGIIPEAYLDENKNPTIGNGILIFRKSDLYDKNAMAKSRTDYLNAFPPEQRAARGKQFDDIANAMKNNTLKTKGGCPNTITNPVTKRASAEDMRYSFNVRFRAWYDRIKNGYSIGRKRVAGCCPYIDQLPLSSQLAIIHCGYAGNAPILEKDPKCRDPKCYPHIIERVAAVRGPQCSIGERCTINDSIKVVNDSIPNVNIPYAYKCTSPAKKKAPAKRKGRGR